VPKKTDKIIEPINAEFDEVVKKMVKVAPYKPIKNKVLAAKTGSQVASYKQVPLDLGIEVEKSVGGIEMGVLENGIPFLTQRGLANIAGAPRSLIYDISQEWAEHFGDQVLTKDRLSFLKTYLAKSGYNEPQLYIETIKNGSPHYSYPDIVCMAVLEYYAFETKTPNKKAIDNYRLFATAGLRKFIFDSLGYVPADKWAYHNARQSILQDSVPLGYFSVFHEISGLVVDLINADLTVNDKTVPDGSVGSHWSTYWKNNDLEDDFGPRIDYAHNYPASYPQALSNPQVVKAYPDEALPKFRKWFKREYLTTKFPTYILKKAIALPGGKAEAEKLANMFQPKQLAAPRKKK